MTIFNLNFCTSGSTNPTGWNKISDFSAPRTQALEDDGGSTSAGVEFSSTTAWTGATGSGAIADNALHDFPELVWEFYFYGGSGAGAFDITGLTSGDDYTISLIGHRGSTGRDTDFTVEATTERYVASASTTAMTAPVVFTGTVPGDGILSVSQDIVSVFSYCNGAILEVVAGGGGGFQSAWAGSSNAIIG